MPNWCENDLTIEGKLDKLQEFRERLRGVNRNGEETPLNEDALIPYPEKFKEMDKVAAQYLKEHPGEWQNAPKDGFNSGGYEWCIEHWGTSRDRSCRSMAMMKARWYTNSIPPGRRPYPWCGRWESSSPTLPSTCAISKPACSSTAYSASNMAKLQTREAGITSATEDDKSGERKTTEADDGAARGTVEDGQAGQD